MIRRLVGDVKINALAETDAGPVIQEIIPNATQDKIRSIPWLRPHYANDSGALKAVVQSFLIVADGKRIVVDTCVGNGKTRTEMPSWNQLDTDYLGYLSRYGFSPEGIDYVVCTHLHFDHVGWNTKLSNGAWVPTFPNARYIFAQEEWAYWRVRPAAEIEDDHAGIDDSVRPVVDHGLSDFVEVPSRLTDSVDLVPTPGHTPHHFSVRIKSKGETAVITGDAMHHPCQIAHPEWGTESDTLPDVAHVTRTDLLQYCVENNVLLLGSHFPHPTGGYIDRDGEGFRLREA